VSPFKIGFLVKSARISYDHPYGSATSFLIVEHILFKEAKSCTILINPCRILTKQINCPQIEQLKVVMFETGVELIKEQMIESRGKEKSE